MERVGHTSEHDQITAGMYQPNLVSLENIDRETGGLSSEEVAHISQLMRALADLRDAEKAILVASEKYMKLSAQDMQALHYLIAAKRIDEVVTPRMIAAHLKVSPASTTKLLNRLEHGGHVVRRMHPTDRRAFAIEITPETESSAKQTIGRQHAKRVNAAARLTRDERETVIHFLNDMTDEISLANADWAN